MTEPAGFVPDPPGFVPDAGAAAPAKKGVRFAHEWDDADLRKSQAAQDAIRAASENEDEAHTPLLDRAAHFLMGATESVPGASLADEVRGVGSTVPDALKPLLTSPLAVPLATAALAVDKLRGTGKYEAGRDAQREAQAMSDADPLVHLGRIAGALAQLPAGGAAAAGKGAVGAAIQGAKAGALGGAMQGFGEGEGAKDSLERAAKSAATGGASGGALAGALGALGALRGSSVDVDVSSPVRNAAASGLSAAANVAPTAGQVIGAVKGGAAAGPVGIVGGGIAGKRAGQMTAKALSKLASIVRPLVDVTPDMVVDTKPGPIPYDILEELGVRPEPRAAAASAPSPPPSSSSAAPDVIDAEYEIAHAPPPPSRPPMKLLPEGQRIDFTDQAEAFDPGAKAWLSWLEGKAPKPSARPDLDQAAAVLAQKTGAGSSPVYNPEGIGTPTGKKIGADLAATEHPEDFAANEGALKSKLAALQDLEAGEPKADAEGAADTRAEMPAATRELSLPELRDQEARALRDGRPTKVQEALRAFRPSSGDVPSPADLERRNAALLAAVERMPEVPSASVPKQPVVDAEAAKLLAAGMRPVDVARALFKRGLTFQASMQDPYFAKALANYRAGQLGM